MMKFKYKDVCKVLKCNCFAIVFCYELVTSVVSQPENLANVKAHTNSHTIT